MWIAATSDSAATVLAAIGAGAVLLCLGSLWARGRALRAEVLRTRWYADSLREEVLSSSPRRHRRPVSGGVLICDWVDDELLASVARQKDLAPAPVRSEKSQGRKSSRGMKGGAARLGAWLGRETSEETTDFFELPQDSNALLATVIGALSQRQELIDDLEEPDLPSAFKGPDLDEMIRAAKDAPAFEEARHAIETLQNSLARQSVLERWQSAAEASRFALVESIWDVEGLENDDFNLRLKHMRAFQSDIPLELSAESPWPPSTDIPVGLEMLVPISRTHLTGPGKTRIAPGEELRAGILCTTDRLLEAEGQLRLSPIAVFQRIVD